MKYFGINDAWASGYLKCFLDAGYWDNPFDEKASGADSEYLCRVHPSVWRHFSAHPHDRLQVIVSLDTPQPDLSDMIRGAALKGSDTLSRPDPSDIDQIADPVRKALAKLGVEIRLWSVE